MIKVVKIGKYRLVETRHQYKILYMDNDVFVWLFVPGIGLVLEITDKPHKPDHLLASGSYRIYDVIDEPKFIDQKHMELFVGDGKWQGYLLLTGLPTAGHKRSRIIATDEVISLHTRAYA